MVAQEKGNASILGMHLLNAGFICAATWVKTHLIAYSLQFRNSVNAKYSS